MQTNLTYVNKIITHNNYLTITVCILQAQDFLYF